MKAPPLDLVGDRARIAALRRALLAWYDGAKRDLPWRRDTDAYRVLVSELMLQQTRVDVVIPYFERWTSRWPTLDDLAAAPQDDVLAAWSGLGYYRRARSLHAIAQQAAATGGELPRTAAELVELPGIGPYTAAAIASIAFGEEVAVVDGNVERVVTRMLRDERPPGAARRSTVDEAARRLVTARVAAVAERSAPAESLRPGDWNQAMMELGATVCLPRTPRCAECPWATSCAAHRAGRTASVPMPRAKKAARDVTLHAALVRRGERFLLVRREEGALLSGLWELPTTHEGEDVAALAARVADAGGGRVLLTGDAARTFRHTITDRRITVHVHEVDAGPARRASRDGTAWVRESELAGYGVSSMTRKALR